MATRNTTTQAPANPAPTLTAESLKALIHEVLQERERNNRSTDMEALTVKAFKRAGFAELDIKPRENILTYAKWVVEGRRVKTGETGVKVKNLRLFHLSQTEVISKQEQQEYLQEREARKAAKTADRLPRVSPVTPVTAAPVKAKAKPVKVIIAPGKVQPVQ